MGHEPTPKNRWERLIEAVTGIARNDLEPLSRAKRIAVQNVRVALVVSRSDVYQRVRLHAQALSLKTLLAIVPLLAVVFSIFKGFGGLESVQNDIEQLILRNLAASDELRSVVHEHLGNFLANVEGGELGPVSVVILVFSVLSLLSHVEDSVNAVFGVPHRRPLALRFVTYWAILTLGPLVLGASLTLTGALQMGAVRDAIEALPGVSQVLIGATPLLISWLGFTALYVVVPNTRVRLRSAFFAALVAGTAWNVLKYLYAVYASHAVTVQNIYGSLAAIPLFILWIWLSWILVLYGAQLTFAYENASTFWREADGHAEATPNSRELMATRIFLEVTRDFVFANRPATPAELSERLGLARRFVDEVCNTLLDQGFTHSLEGGGLVPARDPATVTVEDVVFCLREGRGQNVALPSDRATETLRELLGKAHERALLEEVDFAGLARSHPPHARSDESTDPDSSATERPAADVH